MEQLNIFDHAASVAAKELGIQQAAEHKRSLLEHARGHALRIAKERGTVTADDVAKALHDEGISIFALGSAAGALFKGGQFEFTGEFIKSERVHSHGNLLRRWRLKG